MFNEGKFTSETAAKVTMMLTMLIGSGVVVAVLMLIWLITRTERAKKELDKFNFDLAKSQEL